MKLVIASIYLPDLTEYPPYKFVSILEKEESSPEPPPPVKIAPELMEDVIILPPTPEEIAESHRRKWSSLGQRSLFFGRDSESMVKGKKNPRF